jgi:hypothetical protein
VCVCERVCECVFSVGVWVGEGVFESARACVCLCVCVCVCVCL